MGWFNHQPVNLVVELEDARKKGLVATDHISPADVSRFAKIIFAKIFWLKGEGPLEKTWNKWGVKS